MEKKFINVMEDSYPLWEHCVAQKYTDLDYDTWCESGGELQFFEGDPDMVRVDSEIGYFAECGDKVFYYMDDFTGKGEKMLRAFFGAVTTHISLGGVAYTKGNLPDGVRTEGLQSWDAWDKIEYGIAWRGGAGYTYWIMDWTEYLNKN